jgi:hypothetical protein
MASSYMHNLLLLFTRRPCAVHYPSLLLDTGSTTITTYNIDGVGAVPCWYFHAAVFTGSIRLYRVMAAEEATRITQLIIGVQITFFRVKRGQRLLLVNGADGICFLGFQLSTVWTSHVSVIAIAHSQVSGIIVGSLRSETLDFSPRALYLMC